MISLCVLIVLMSFFLSLTSAFGHGASGKMGILLFLFLSRREREGKGICVRLELLGKCTYDYVLFRRHIGCPRKSLVSAGGRKLGWKGLGLGDNDLLFPLFRMIEI